MRHAHLKLVLLGLTLWAGCAMATTEQKNTNGGQKMTEAKPQPATPNTEPRPYSKDLAELRALFNRDKGKVRLVTLLSPT